MEWNKAEVINVPKQLSASLEDKDLFSNIPFKIISSSVRFCCNRWEDFLLFIKIKDTSEK